jgi:hypothetical protein
MRSILALALLAASARADTTDTMTLASLSGDSQINMEPNGTDPPAPYDGLFYVTPAATLDGTPMPWVYMVDLA